MATAKRPLLELLRRHSDWQEEDLAVVTEIQNVRPIDRDAVDEGVFALRELGEEKCSPRCFSVFWPCWWCAP